MDDAILLRPIGYVRGGRAAVADDGWDAVEARIELNGTAFSPESLSGLEGFSHLVVLTRFHLADPGKVEREARHPRNNPALPKVGIFAQRGKNRPNHLGVSVCRILGVEGLAVRVAGLDAVDGTPVLDLKPYMTGFEARGQVREPEWAREIMSRYW